MADAAPEIDIRADATLWDRNAADPQIARAAEAALAGFDGVAEISVLLTDDKAMAALNEKWRGKEGPTNVLSFPGDDGPTAPGAPVFLGDIVLAFETLEREAAGDGKPFSDHLVHLVVHGVLHLRGYDHETDDEAAEMEALETELLAGLGIPDPYREDAEILDSQKR
jgi:probable rRNA maturation factor